jgi:hypothetical protein
MNNIFTGYYNKSNYGDDLFETIAGNIAKQYKKKINRYKIVPISRIADKENHHMPNIVILFGGEVLNDFFLTELIKLRAFNPKIIFKAIGVSCNQDYATLVNKMQLFETVIFRAKKDYTYFKGILGGQCFYCPDMVFTYRLRTGFPFKHKKNVGFFLSQTAVKPDTKERIDYIVSMVRCVRFWIDQGYSVKMFAMCTNTAMRTENDNLMNTDIYTRLTRIEQAKVKYYRSNKVILGRLKKLDFAVCWRYHAHILCILTNVPFLSLSPTPKVENLLLDNELSTYAVKNVAEYERKCLDLMERQASIKQQLKIVAKQNHTLAKFYLTEAIYFSMKPTVYRYLNDKALEQMKTTVIEKYQAMKNRFVTGNDKAMFVLFCLLREFNTEYEYGLAEKIKKGMSLNELKNDINWLINEAILRGNRMIYYLNAEASPVGKGFNINYINQDNYKGLHRAGWSYVVDHLQASHHSGGLLCDLYLDRTFHWNAEVFAKVKLIPYVQPWVGFIHHTTNVDYSEHNTVALFRQPLFLASLAHCKGLVVLSQDLKHAVEILLGPTAHPGIPVFALTHPTEFVPESAKFTMDNFKANPEPKIVQVGAWMRNLNAINELCTTSLVKKAVLKGKKMEHYYEESKSKSNVFDPLVSRDNKSRPLVLNKDVQVLTYLENEAYDTLFKQNVVFLNLIDASAVNTIVECIVRNTPIFVNRLPATEEALGANYPLFYTNIKDVTEMLTLEKIKAGNIYLKKLDKTKFKIETFLAELNKI